MKTYTSQLLAALRVAQVSLMVCGGAGIWIAVISFTAGEPGRVLLGILGVFVALVAAGALYRLSDLRVDR